MSIQQHEDNAQVMRNTEFGQRLFQIASLPMYKTFLEVGTWKGNGSTRCIIEGLLQRLRGGSEDVHFWSLEANKYFFDEAVKLWEPEALPFLHLMYGKLHTSGLLSAEEVERHTYFGNVKTHYEYWYKQDAIDYANSPFVNPQLLPPTIDVLILDGGEFSGYADWDALKDKQPKLVILDDTGVMKNERVYKELKANPSWICRVDSQDRNGWAMFERRTHMNRQDTYASFV